MAEETVNELVQIQPRKSGLTAEQAREKLSGARGAQYWRSLEELTAEPGFDEMMQREFPRHAAEWTDPVSRRGFLKLMSASMALAGLSACTKQPFEPIVPYVQQPEELVPGKPIYFATARPTPNGAYPLLVRSHEYRPVKIEGNPDHPASKSLAQSALPADNRWGTTDVQSQASVLDLYDPERSQDVTFRGEIRTWGAFAGAMRDAFGAERGRGGAGFRLLTDTVTSPTLAAQIKSVLQANPQAKWYQWDAMNRDNARTGTRLAFGQYLDAQYQLAHADVIVSLDADFLSGSHFPGFLPMSRDFILKRKLDLGPDGEAGGMNRLYVVESQSTTTGGKADNRLPLRASDIEQFTAALANALGVGGANGAVKDDRAKKFLDAVAKDLKGARGRSVIIPGEQQSPAVHALAVAMNSALGNIGKTVVYAEPVEAVPTEQATGLKELVSDINAGKVTMLVMIGVNPLFDTPADLHFADAFQKVPMRAHVGMFHDETSRLSHWHVPLAHYLETWSDTRSYDGTASIVQPLIDPLFNGRSAHEVVALFIENSPAAGYDAVRKFWQDQSKTPAANFDQFWNRALHDGFLANSAPAARGATAARAGGITLSPVNDDLEIVFRPDPAIQDGRFINNGWLQELPKPISKLTWDNAAIMSQNTARQLGVKTEDVVTLEVNGGKVDAPVLIVPGHPDKTITAHYGYGRTYVGSVGMGTGFNAFVLRTSDKPNFATGVKVSKKGDRWRLALTQHHHLIDTKKGEQVEGSSEAGNAAATRDLVRTASYEEWRKTPGFAIEGEKAAPSRDLTLYGENGYKSWVDDPAKNAAHQWGMAIDMNSCVGCNACVIACVAENNIPVVGKEQVLMGREMHWLRIDTYFTVPNTNDVSNPRAFFQPLPCMQCENAPCEPVCPVGATVHSPEGLNNMVYNRCVGTRYCSNNCPYKVRRFNFLLFADYETESYKSRNNPDVTVRSRGVMEKCTYCVQRITSARIAAEKEERKVRDGEIVTACQQTCPTDAITFGDITDKNSRVMRMKRSERNYALLAEVNTRPRTTYIAEVTNPNPELEVTTENHGHNS